MIKMKADDIRGTLVSDGDTGKIIDNTELETMTVSTTRLKPYKGTVGSSANGVEKVYYFTSGSGLIYLDGTATFVVAGSIVLVADGVYHKVTTGPDGLSFLCVFNGRRTDDLQDPRTLPGYTECF
jgi:mannose-6-phosphate isomerase-like protein (cupin superfamily)